MIHFPIQCHLVVTSAELSILSVFLNVKLDSKHARRGEFGTGTFNRPLRDVDVWPSAKCLELLYRKFESAPQKVLEKTILESYYKIRALNCAPSFSMYDIRVLGPSGLVVSQLSPLVIGRKGPHDNMPVKGNTWIPGDRLARCSLSTQLLSPIFSF